MGLFSIRAKKFWERGANGSECNLSLPQHLFLWLWEDDLILLTASLGEVVATRPPIHTHTHARCAHSCPLCPLLAHLQLSLNIFISVSKLGHFCLHGGKGVCANEQPLIGCEGDLGVCTFELGRLPWGWTQRMLSGWACGTASLSCRWPLWAQTGSKG